MIFGDWRSKGRDAKISDSLLWEYNLSDFDWYAMRTVVMQRIIERGRMQDFYAALKIYGGLNKVKEIIKEIPSLSAKDMNFVCLVFNIKKEELRCYKRKRSREKLLNF